MSLKYCFENIPFEFTHEICYRWNKFFKNRPSSRPFLSGDSYRALADVLYDNTHRCNADEINSFKGETVIVFLSSWFMKDFTENVLKDIKKPFILITHQGDVNIDSSKEYVDVAENPFLKKWFCQNCTLKHEKVIPLPIGLEDRWRHNAGAISDFRKKTYINRRKMSKILFGFSINTNPAKRVPCYLAFAKSKIADEIYKAPNAHLYRKLLSKYMFVASPEGNGLDCHRTWEAMYLNVIPIVEENEMTLSFEKLSLPVWCIKDWKEVSSMTEEELAEKYDEIMKKSNKDALWLSYWKKEIEK